MRQRLALSEPHESGALPPSRALTPLPLDAKGSESVVIRTDSKERIQDNG